MKAALLYGVRDLRVEDIPRPKPGPQEVLVRVNACGVCPTDIRKFLTLDGGALILPANVGHEFVGTVAEVGPGVRGFEHGMRIMGDGFGAYAEYAIVSLGSTPLPTRLTLSLFRRM